MSLYFWQFNLSPFLWIRHIICSFHSFGILSFSDIMPTNLWILFITSSLLCLSSAGMPSMPTALLLCNFCRASWVSCSVGACIPISPLCVFIWYYSMSSAVVSLLCLFSFRTSSKCSFHLPSVCSLLPIMFPSVSLHWSVSFIFCTILYSCLRFLSLNSSSTAVNCWLITHFFPFYMQWSLISFSPHILLYLLSSF